MDKIDNLFRTKQNTHRLALISNLICVLMQNVDHFAVSYRLAIAFVSANV